MFKIQCYHLKPSQTHSVINTSNGLGYLAQNNKINLAINHQTLIYVYILAINGLHYRARTNIEAFVVPTHTKARQLYDATKHHLI